MYDCFDMSSEIADNQVNSNINIGVTHLTGIGCITGIRRNWPSITGIDPENSNIESR